MHNQISNIDKWIVENYIKDGLVILDVETTGFSNEKDRIVEFAAIKTRDNKIIDRTTFLVQSDKQIPWQTTKVHGITNDMMREGVTEKKAVSDIIQFLQGDFIIVGHNVKFDIGFLEQLLQRNGYKFSCTYMDTLQLAKKYLGGRASYSLGNLASELGFIEKGMHRALVDVEVTYKLLQEIIRQAV